MSGSLEDRLGRCYQLAAEMTYPDQDLVVVHGTIQSGDHPPVNHAWVVHPDGSITDPVLERLYPPDSYVLLMNAVEHCSHPARHVFRILEYTGHWGPWKGFCSELTEPV